MNISSTKISKTFVDQIIDDLKDIKAENIQTFNLSVDHLNDFDYVIIATGRSNRHTKAISDHLIKALRDRNIRPWSVEGQQAAHWILLDLGDVMLHIMQAQVREYYQLEKIWGMSEY